MIKYFDWLDYCFIGEQREREELHRHHASLSEPATSRQPRLPLRPPQAGIRRSGACIHRGERAGQAAVPVQDGGDEHRGNGRCGEG